MARNEPSLEHNFFVRTLAVWLERNGYAVGTCLEEQEQDKPPLLNGHRPDVYAMKRGSPSVIGLVELCDRLHDGSTRERWQAVFAAANRPGCHPGYELHIIVPSRCLDEAEQQAGAWGVTATFHTEKIADQPGPGSER